MGKMVNTWVERSFKREMATLVLGFWGIMTIRHFNLTDPILVNAQSPSYNTMTMVVLPIVGLAFGVDAFWKQAPGAKP